jgi:flagellar basal body P-ring protein FlgI
MKAMLRSAKGSFRSFFAISNEKTGIISVRNRNVAMKNRNVAIDNRNVEVDERNVAETEKKFHALKKILVTLKYEKIRQINKFLIQ